MGSQMQWVEASRPRAGWSKSTPMFHTCPTCLSRPVAPCGRRRRITKSRKGEQNLISSLCHRSSSIVEHGSQGNSHMNDDNMERSVLKSYNDDCECLSPRSFLFCRFYMGNYENGDCCWSCCERRTNMTTAVTTRGRLRFAYSRTVSKIGRTDTKKRRRYDGTHQSQRINQIKMSYDNSKQNTWKWTQ